MSEGKAGHHMADDDDDDPLTFTKIEHTPNGDQITTQRLLPDGSYQWESHGPLGHSTGFTSGAGGNGFYSSSSSMSGTGGLTEHYQASGMHSAMGGFGQGQAQAMGFGPGQGSFQGSQMGTNGMAMMSAQGQGTGTGGMVHGQAMFNGMPSMPSMAPIKFAPMVFPNMQPMKPMKMWPSIFGRR